MISVLDKPKRDVAPAMLKGMRGKCPNCGQGTLFGGFLKVAESCNACGQELHHHRADDAPAYLTILIVGHIMLPLVLGIEELFAPPVWVHVALWGTLIPAACLALLRPIKGMIVGLQWASGMHGFGSGNARADA
jgi:uncharacterized protein (DUF983 family)